MSRSSRRAVFAGVVAFAMLLGPSAVAAEHASQPFEPPVDGTVIDRFRPPAHVGAPGNRGWEYRTAPGSTVTAAGQGVVAFAGQIGGRLYVSIDHPNGLRTTYSLLDSVTVVAGQTVTGGTEIGTTGLVFHFGVRRGRLYLDPADLFAFGARTTVRLVPVSSRR